MLTFTTFAGYAGRFPGSSNICLFIHFGCLRDRENLLNGIIIHWNKNIFAFTAVFIWGNSNNFYIHSVHLGQLHINALKNPRCIEQKSPFKELDSSCLKIVGYGKVICTSLTNEIKHIFLYAYGLIILKISDDISKPLIMTFMYS